MSKKTPSQLDRDVAEAVSGYRSKYGHGTAEWKRGYDFGWESSRHETHAQMREILRQLIASVRTDFDRGMVAAYEAALGIIR